MIVWEQFHGSGCLPYKVYSREDGSAYVDIPIGRMELFAGNWIGYDETGDPVRVVRCA